MKVTFNGAAGSVTGSRHLLEACGRRVLLDCGLVQGRREESDRQNRDPGFDARSIDAVLLSHSHIDHAGSIPSLVKAGFRGRIHCTSATADLARIMLADSARIQVADAEFLTKRRSRNGQPPVRPLYTPEDADAAMDLFSPVPYYTRFDVDKGIRARFIEAGHILGSAQIEVECSGSADRQVLLYSGDIGRPSAPILRDPDLKASGPDMLLMESTYGGRNHDTQQDSVAKLRKIVSSTASRGGRVIIPAFSVGRTQEILYFLRVLRREGSIPGIPVFVDSPLSFDATEVYRTHPECYDDEARALFAGDESPFRFEGLSFLRTVEGSKALNSVQEPMIIISASGMCEHGRILHHLVHSIGNPANTIVVVGFMAAHTLGRRLADRETTVRIFGEQFERKAEVRILNGFSAHADSDGLVEYALKAGAGASKVVLVHGEAEQTEALRRRLEDEAGIRADTPSVGETVEL